MDYNQIKEDQKEYLNMFGYENNFKTKVNIYIPEILKTMVFDHDQDYLVEFEGYIRIAKNLWKDVYIPGSGGMYPIELARRVYGTLLHINALMSKELFTKQNVVDSINRANYSTDQEFVNAVEAVQWGLDLTQTFTVISTSDSIDMPAQLYTVSGGTTGQVLSKNSNTDYDCVWISSTGSGDMVKSVYDTGNNGVVDNSERLNGQLPSFYATSGNLNTHTGDITVHRSINDSATTITNLWSADKINSSISATNKPQSTITDDTYVMLERIINVACVNPTATAVPSTLAAIDGYTPVVGDRVLLCNATASTLQGVYEVKASGTTWTRAVEMDTVLEATDRMVKVNNGSTYRNTFWTITTKGVITLGTTAIKFTQQFLDFGTGLSVSTAGVVTVASSPTSTVLTTSRTIGTLTGDVTAAGGSFNGGANQTSTSTVTKIQGYSVSAVAPQNGQVLTYSSTSTAWMPQPATYQATYRPNTDGGSTSWSSNTNYEYTITVTGAVVGRSVSVNPDSALYTTMATAGCTFNVTAFVSAPNTVKVLIRTGTYLAVGASDTIRITVI